MGQIAITNVVWYIFIRVLEQQKLFKAMVGRKAQMFNFRNFILNNKVVFFLQELNFFLPYKKFVQSTLKNFNFHGKKKNFSFPVVSLSSG